MSAFLPRRKNKHRERLPAHSRPSPSPTPAASSPHDSGPTSRPSPSVKPQGNTTEFKLFSSGISESSRYNIMKLNSGRDIDPTQISRPILMNRKLPGPRAPPTFAFDDEGKITGRYMYDESGKPIIGPDGKPTVEMKSEMDMSLVGTAPGEGERRKVKKGVKEVFHQDIDVIRLRREENTPWVLESGQPRDGAGIPEHWVGRMMEPSAMPTVLLINDGRNKGFSVVTLGRTYRFEPERPFKVLDPDAAHKLFEHQAKYKIHDRWAQREGGPSIVAGPSEPRMEVEGEMQVKQEERAMRMEHRMRAARAPNQPRIKTERFDDDSRREGRQTERGLEGGVDEELDYDVNDDFQDDEENNTFYRNEDEEEEAKLQDERLKKEFRLANANVGDKPQIDEDEDGEGDLFGDNLNQEGKKLKRMMRKRLNGQADDLFSESDSDEESPDAETVKADKDKDKEKDKEGQKSVPPSAERPSRPPSRGPTTGRGTSSPTGRRSNPLPTSGKASTAPPGSGSALLAQRAASRGASPHRSRQPSPLNRRATSPETGNGRTVSPATSAGGTSPPASGRATTPTSTAPAEPKQGKRKTTSESPFKDDPSSFAQKRKPSPSPSAPDGNRDRKKKKSAWTTPTPAGPDIAPFPGMITQSDVLAWFKRQGGVSVPMSVTISEFKQRIVDAGARKEDNQKLFLHWVGAVTVPEPGKRLRLKEGL